jgi:hypothetical protein
LPADASPRLEIECQPRLRIDQWSIAAHLNLLEKPMIVAVQSTKKASVRRGIDLADRVVHESLGIVSDAIGKALLVAIGDFVGNANV